MFIGMGSNRTGPAAGIARALLRFRRPRRSLRAGHPGPPGPEDRDVFIESQAADPAVHQLSIRIARRCVFIIQAVLREEERGEAMREFYRVCREELDKPAPAGEV